MNATKQRWCPGCRSYRDTIRVEKGFSSGDVAGAALFGPAGWILTLLAGSTWYECTACRQQVSPRRNAVSIFLVWILICPVGGCFAYVIASETSGSHADSFLADVGRLVYGDSASDPFASGVAVIWLVASIHLAIAVTVGMLVRRVRRSRTRGTAPRTE